MIIVAARRAFDRRPRLASVHRSINGRVRDIDDVWVFRIDCDLTEVPATSPDAIVARRFAPGSACVVGTIKTTGLRIDDCVDAIAIRGRDCDSYAPLSLGGNAVHEWLPVVAAVRGFKDPPAGSVRRRIDAPRWTTSVPQSRIDHLRILWIESEIDRADVVAFEQHLLPGGSAVARAIHASIRIRAVGVAERGNKHDAGIFRIDDDAANLPRIVQADVRPGLPRINGLVHPVAVGNLRAHVCFTRADVDYVRVRRRDTDGADRGDGLRVENWRPGAARVHRLPNAAAHGAEIKSRGLARHATDGVDTSAAERTNISPT